MTTQDTKEPAAHETKGPGAQQHTIHWLRSPLIVATAGAMLALIGNIVVTELDAQEKRTADREQHCYDMISDALRASAGDIVITKKNLAFLKSSKLLAKCDDIDIDAAMPSEDTPQYIAPVATAASPALAGTGAALQVYLGCAGSGDATDPVQVAFNQAVNRSDLPQAPDFDANATLSALLKGGDDTTRWSSGRAAAVDGYVLAVERGGAEGANCHGRAGYDTVLEIGATPGAGRAERFLAKVTPRLRALATANGQDWSLPGLERAYLGKRVHLEGWLVFDQEHAPWSANTVKPHVTPDRGTAWELHPVISIALPGDAGIPDAASGG